MIKLVRNVNKNFIIVMTEFLNKICYPEREMNTFYIKRKILIIDMCCLN